MECQPGTIARKSVDSGNPLARYSSSRSNMVQSWEIIDGLARLNSGSFSIWPNPSEGTIVVNSTDYDKMVSISVFTLDGCKIFSKGNYRFNTRLDLSGIQPGMYIIKIEGEHFLTQEKILVQ